MPRQTSMSCISLYSYIKPQPRTLERGRRCVVYLYIPTSNHNRQAASKQDGKVVYLYIPTPNHNYEKYAHSVISVVYLYIPTPNHNFALVGGCPLTLYIFIFLHQTTTVPPVRFVRFRCISLYSYIKPQLSSVKGKDSIVVYLYIPTSNHNHSLISSVTSKLYIFIFLHQTTTE